jgi:hypothetical protein
VDAPADDQVHRVDTPDRYAVEAECIPVDNVPEVAWYLLHLVAVAEVDIAGVLPWDLDRAGVGTRLVGVVVVAAADKDIPVAVVAVVAVLDATDVPVGTVAAADNTVMVDSDSLTHILDDPLALVLPYRSVH